MNADFYFEDNVLIYMGENPSTIEAAFDISIGKFEAERDYILAKNFVPHPGGYKTCGLCMMYVKDLCGGCPIATESGEDSCHANYPYQHLIKAYLNDDIPAALAACDDEIAFLKKLRAKYCDGGKS